MIVAIHQPNYIPWSGYFYKILKSDVFIFLDDAQYTKNSFINRNRIKTPTGEAWLTVPVKASLTDKINEVVYADAQWKKKHIKSLEQNYKKAPFFEHYASDLWEIINQENDHLYILNIALISYIAEQLSASCRFMLASEFPSEEKSDLRLIELVQRNKGTHYLSGRGGANYQDENNFTAQGITLAYTDYVPQPYPQLWPEYIPNLSMLDLLFNCGPDARKIILGH